MPAAPRLLRCQPGFLLVTGLLAVCGWQLHTFHAAYSNVPDSRWLYASVFTAVLLGLVALHELGHVLAARLHGHRVTSVRIGSRFGVTTVPARRIVIWPPGAFAANPTNWRSAHRARKVWTLTAPAPWFVVIGFFPAAIHASTSVAESALPASSTSVSGTFHARSSGATDTDAIRPLRMLAWISAGASVS